MKPECELRKNLFYGPARLNSQQAVTIPRLRIAPAISAYDHAAVCLTIQMVNQLKEVLGNLKRFLLGQNPIVYVMAVKVTKEHITSSDIDDRRHKAVHPYQLDRLQIGLRLPSLILEECLLKLQQLFFPFSLCSFGHFTGLILVVLKHIFQEIKHLDRSLQKLNLFFLQPAPLH